MLVYFSQSYLVVQCGNSVQFRLDLEGHLVVDILQLCS